MVRDSVVASPGAGRVLTRALWTPDPAENQGQVRTGVTVAILCLYFDIFFCIFLLLNIEVQVTGRPLTRLLAMIQIKCKLCYFSWFPMIWFSPLLAQELHWVFGPVVFLSYCLPLQKELERRLRPRKHLVCPSFPWFERCVVMGRGGELRRVSPNVFSFSSRPRPRPPLQTPLSPRVSPPRRCCPFQKTPFLCCYYSA